MSLFKTLSFSILFFTISFQGLRLAQGTSLSTTLTPGAASKEPQTKYPKVESKSKSEPESHLLKFPKMVGANGSGFFVPSYNGESVLSKSPSPGQTERSSSSSGPPDIFVERREAIKRNRLKPINESEKEPLGNQNSGLQIDTSNQENLIHLDSSSPKDDSYESIRSTLVMLQCILLVTAGIVFVSVILYSIYYIRLIREIYDKKDFVVE